MLKFGLLAALVAILAGCGVVLKSSIDQRRANALRDTPPTGEMLTINGAKVHVHVEGTGPDVILIHGAGGNWREWTYSLIPKLKGEFRFFAVDRPGHGYSSRIPTRANEFETIDEQSALIAAAVNQLGAKDPIVLGQSYGGAVALSYALNHDAKAAVIVAGVSNPWPGDIDAFYYRMSGWLGRNILAPLAATFATEERGQDTVENIFAPDPVPPGYLDHMGLDLAVRPIQLVTNAGMVKTLRPQIVAQSERYKDLEIPVEIVHGTADTTVPFDVHAEPLHEELPNSRLIPLEGIGHMPQHAAEAQVIDALRSAAKRAGLR
ncbi:pimeloyl-ACP methyl ester carboxylesterase [Litoreibacter ponti]|uniref:Pimeloyl-ACP methyl ester carboxylesterase n=1 Tax=Litoreibacter ponti TaxID=1510457 RepID=A0A2T6BI99_9RHOB|nr:alpha/beta hydrolase [Litoreibacter ponti]PTX55788.1 pimeloyl-ACP methyl ester carboxylesterase [Litoreibacter ponti]